MLLRYLLSLAFAVAPGLGFAHAPPIDKLGVDPRNDDTVVLSELRGRVVAIAFWASWCGPCLKELPVLDSIQKQISRDKLRIIAINYDEDRKTFHRNLRQLRTAELTMLHDNRNRIGKAFGVKGLPHLVLIDHRGDVREAKTGYSEGALQGLIDEMNGLLRERAQDLGSQPANGADTPADED